MNTAPLSALPQSSEIGAGAACSSHASGKSARAAIAANSCRHHSPTPGVTAYMRAFAITWAPSTASPYLPCLSRLVRSLIPEPRRVLGIRQVCIGRVEGRDRVAADEVGSELVDRLGRAGIRLAERELRAQRLPCSSRRWP